MNCIHPCSNCPCQVVCWLVVWQGQNVFHRRFSAWSDAWGGGGSWRCSFRRGRSLTRLCPSYQPTQILSVIVRWHVQRCICCSCISHCPFEREGASLPSAYYKLIISSSIINFCPFIGNWMAWLLQVLQSNELTIRRMVVCLRWKKAMTSGWTL